MLMNSYNRSTISSGWIKNCPSYQSAAARIKYSSPCCSRLCVLALPKLGVNTSCVAESSLRQMFLAGCAGTYLLLHVGVAAAEARELPSVNVIAEVSEKGFMGFGNTANEDGSNPFTVYGVAFKKYVIEVLDGEKIVSRKRGFTVNCCTAAITVAQEDEQGPRYQGLSIGDKMNAVNASTRCRKAEGTDLRPVCQTSCETSCNDTVNAYVEGESKKTGIAVEEKERQRITKSCIRDCRTECSKPGKVFDFIISSHR